MYPILAILGGFLWCYSMLAPRIERTPFGGPILFVLFGVLMGPVGLDLLPWEPDAELLSVLAELTLSLVLLTDAAGADLTVLRRAKGLPIRLLGIGLPLTILLGALAGKAVFPHVPWLELALLATMLAPTDAALGKAVVTNEAVPGPIRQGLNVESGLNDGICVPVLFLFLSLIDGETNAHGPITTGLILFGQAVGIGALVGAVLALLAVWLLKISKDHRWLGPAWSKVSLLALAFTCFGTAQALGGSGFIASFVCGLLFGELHKPHHEPFLEAAEGIGDAFALLTWVLFGAIVVSMPEGGFPWTALLYAILSLTLIRMLPVYLALMGSGLRMEARSFIGWFGPRGLASIVFAVMVIDAHTPHGKLLTQTVALTVLLSILLHGLSASPWSRRLGRHAV